MSTEEQTRFLQELAHDLNSREIALPSFPEAVINIRSALEDPACSAKRLGSVVKTDPVLVARLLISANSAFHNRAGIEIVDLELAISRLGFEVVRNTAITLAVEQIFNASRHKELRHHIKPIWDTSLSLASMSFVIAQHLGRLNPDNAFLCGLFREVGKLYILTKARSYPKLMGDDKSLDNVLQQWYTSVGKSIVAAWGFSEEIGASMSDEQTSSGANGTATFADVIFCARALLAQLDAGELPEELAPEMLAALEGVGADGDAVPAIVAAYERHRQSVLQGVTR